MNRDKLIQLLTDQSELSEEQKAYNRLHLIQVRDGYGDKQKVLSDQDFIEFLIKEADKFCDLICRMDKQINRELASSLDLYRPHTLLRKSRLNILNHIRRRILNNGSDPDITLKDRLEPFLEEFPSDKEIFRRFKYKDTFYAFIKSTLDAQKGLKKENKGTIKETYKRLLEERKN